MGPMRCVGNQAENRVVRQIRSRLSFGVLAALTVILCACGTSTSAGTTTTSSAQTSVTAQSSATHSGSTSEGAVWSLTTTSPDCGLGYFAWPRQTVVETCHGYQSTPSYSYSSYDNLTGKPLAHAAEPTSHYVEPLQSMGFTTSKGDVLVDFVKAQTAAQGLTPASSSFSLRGLNPRTLAVQWSTQIADCSGDASCILPEVVLLPAEGKGDDSVIQLMDQYHSGTAPKSEGVDLTSGKILWSSSAYANYLDANPSSVTHIISDRVVLAPYSESGNYVIVDVKTGGIVQQLSSSSPWGNVDKYFVQESSTYGVTNAVIDVTTGSTLWQISRPSVIIPQVGIFLGWSTSSWSDSTSGVPVAYNLATGATMWTLPVTAQYCGYDNQTKQIAVVANSQLVILDAVSGKQLSYDANGSCSTLSANYRDEDVGTVRIDIPSTVVQQYDTHAVSAFRL